jgi:DNA-binding XRE family transcriptional regulator
MEKVTFKVTPCIFNSMERKRPLVDPTEVRRVRVALGMTQGQFAAALGIHVRTVVRGEARGLEVPWRGDTLRPGVWLAWYRLKAKANRAKKS